MSKQIQVHSPQQRAEKTKRTTPLYSHSPYSWTNSPMEKAKMSQDEAACSSPTAGIPIPQKNNICEHFSYSAHSSHGNNNSLSGSPVYDMYASYSSNKGVEDALVVPSNFLNSNGSHAGSPPALGSSYSPKSYHSNTAVSNSRGAECATPTGFGKSPGSVYPPSSYAPISFSPPNPASASLQAPFTAGCTTEPFGVSPSVLSRGFVDSYLANSGQAAPSAPSSSSASVSNASSVAENLPLCPEDEDCVLINEKTHQRKFAHTCRLFPCYHGHISRHAKLFRHVPGQVVLPEGVSKKLSSHALTSVTFSNISPEAPNAFRIYVAHQGKKYELFGDWENVKVHTFKRYLHQVCSIPPASQSLAAAKTSKIMDDDIRSVKSYGIEEDALILLTNREEEFASLRIAFDDL